ncbi:MAG: DUF1624 domain-containing protein [Actinobacteria bacterium]|nr:DUF1624 domain-containing protein [Actinomycetota bacterium]
MAGIGLALANGRQNPPQGSALRAARVGVLARVPIVAVIGLILGELDSGVAIILVNYALLFLFSTIGLGWSIRRLLWVAAIWVALIPIASHLARTVLPETTFLQPNLTALLQPITLLRELLLTGYYPVIPWLGYIWAGMAVGRLDLTSRKVARRLALAGGALAFASTVVSNLVVGDRLGDLPIQFFGVTPTDSLLYLAVATPHSAAPLDLLHTIGSSLFVVAVALLIVRVLGWLAAAGAMTLSLYTIHVLALATRAGIEDRSTLLVVHVIIAFVAGWIWAQLVGRGPLEQLLASTSARARAVAFAAIPRADRSPP